MFIGNSFKRHIAKALQAWKNRPDRKPLILRGARQVGKTTLVNQFSKNYQYFISLNLERIGDVRYFTDFTDAKTITDALFIAHSISSDKKSKNLIIYR